MVSLFRVLVIFSAVACCVDTARAAEWGSPQVWINPGLYSYHFNRDKNLRDGNVGFGAEVELTRSQGFMIGTYINSNDARSDYGAYLWRPLHSSIFGLDVYAGAAFGAINGYPNYKGGAWFPIALPVLAVEGKRLGANFSVIPTISNRVDGAFAIQVKLRLW